MQRKEIYSRSIVQWHLTRRWSSLVRERAKRREEIRFRPEIKPPKWAGLKKHIHLPLRLCQALKTKTPASGKEYSGNSADPTVLRYGCEHFKVASKYCRKNEAVTNEDGLTRYCACTKGSSRQICYDNIFPQEKAKLKPKPLLTSPGTTVYRKQQQILWRKQINFNKVYDDFLLQFGKFLSKYFVIWNGYRRLKSRIKHRF